MIRAFTSTSGFRCQNASHYFAPLKHTSISSFPRKFYTEMQQMSSKLQPGVKGNLPSSINLSYLGNRVKIAKLCPVNEMV
jgi:hypothetical protein